MVDSMCLTRPAHKVCKGLKRARPILRVFAALSTPWLRAKTAPMISLNISDAPTLNVSDPERVSI